jgi:hypothetical protein
VVYSIGPDGKDDGGAPVFDSRGRDDVSEDSKGDIVAGINRY